MSSAAFSLVGHAGLGVEEAREHKCELDFGTSQVIRRFDPIFVLRLNFFVNCQNELSLVSLVSKLDYMYHHPDCEIDLRSGMLATRYKRIG